MIDIQSFISYLIYDDILCSALIKQPGNRQANKLLELIVKIQIKPHQIKEYYKKKKNIDKAKESIIKQWLLRTLKYNNA